MLQSFTVYDNEGNGSITVVVPGHGIKVTDNTNPNWDKIQELVKIGDTSVVDLFDLADTVSKRFANLSSKLSDRVKVDNGHVFVDDNQINNTLTDKIVSFLNEGLDFEPLVNFLVLVLDNPNDHSREQLYRWLDTHNFTITPSGWIVGYKGVVSDPTHGYKSVHSGKATVNGVTHTGQIPNPLGATVEMRRPEVTHDPNVGCHQGLHVGTYEYARSFARGGVLEVHVNPVDVVSVPTDSGDAKMRVCRYLVVKEINAPYSSSLRTPTEDDFDWGESDDEDDGECDCWNDNGLYCDGCEDEEIEESEETSSSRWSTPINIVSDPTKATCNGVTISVWDVYQNQDGRHKNYVRVTAFEGDSAVVVPVASPRATLAYGSPRKIKLDRLTKPYRYKKVN